MTPARVAACVVVAVCLSAVPRAAAAQSFDYGAKGGVGLSRTVFQTTFAADSPTAPGPVGGGFVDWTLFGRLAVRGEVDFAQESTTILDIQKDTFRYLDVPILARYRALTLMGRGIFVSGGGVFRSVLDATETVSDVSSSIKDGVSSHVTALALGGGFEFLPRWTVDVRYLHGRTGLYKKIGGGEDGKSRTVQVTVEFRGR
jgi:hypothetical protein